MIINLCTIIDHGHHIWIVSFVVIVKGVKENSKAIPLVCTTKHRTFRTRLVSKPQCLMKKNITSTVHGASPNFVQVNTVYNIQYIYTRLPLISWYNYELPYQTISTNSASACHPEDKLHLPPFKIGRIFRPYLSFLAS